jgi:hypothetical protein
MSIAQPDEPFVIAKASGLPTPGLTPDKANVKRIYDQSCAHCHALAGIEEVCPGLAGLAEMDGRQPGAGDGRSAGWTATGLTTSSAWTTEQLDAQTDGEDVVVNPEATAADAEAAAKHERNTRRKGMRSTGVFKEAQCRSTRLDVLSDRVRRRST